MPQPGWVKPAGDQRLTDHISIGILTRVFPPELVDDVVAETGRSERRRRLLTARVVVYYVLTMALFTNRSYDEVMLQLMGGLAWMSDWQPVWRAPSKVAIYRARERLGPEPLELLFRTVASPLADETTEAAFHRGLRLVSLDETCVDVPDTHANDEAFGRPDSLLRKSARAFPQLRVVGLCEPGTHAITSAALGPYTGPEQELADRMLGELGEGMLCVADRSFYSVERFQRARQTGTQLLWRVDLNLALQRETTLPDGSYLTRIHCPGCAHDGEHARVVEYRLDDPGLPRTERRHRLLCTILDPQQAPTPELAAHYSQRPTIEGALDELETHRRGTRTVLRSKRPAGVYQEAYGYLCTHHAIRRVMHDTTLLTNLGRAQPSLRPRASQPHPLRAEGL